MRGIEWLQIGVKYLYPIACLLLIAGLLLGISEHKVYSYLFLLGGVLFTICAILMPIADSLRLRRLRNMHVFSGVCFILSAALRLGLYPRLGQNVWVLLLAVGVIFMVYSQTVIMRKKEF